MMQLLLKGLSQEYPLVRKQFLQQKPLQCLFWQDLQEDLSG